jgi:hypothetical protein
MKRNKANAAPAKAISFKIGIDIPRLSFLSRMNHPTRKAAITNSRHLPEQLLAS